MEVFGTALFGAILTNRLGHYLAINLGNSGVAVDPAQLEALQSNTGLIATLPAPAQSAVLESFVSSFHVVFLVAAPVVAVGFFVALFLRETPLRTNADYAAARNEAAGEALG